MRELMQSARNIKEMMVEYRRYLHRNPEVGLELPNTIVYVKDKLKEMGIEPVDYIRPLDDNIQKTLSKVGISAGTKAAGIAAVIGKGDKTILLRADMDALPVEELAEVDFKSENGNGHMCGHDMHTAMLLGAAKLLKERESELKGTVKLMFQPGEELGMGAMAMVEVGILNNPKVDAAVALHVMSDLETGMIEYEKGIVSASMDTYVVQVQGKGGHSSQPQNSIDPIMIINSIYTSVNQLVGREIDPRETVALTVGRMGGGTAVNIIPDSAEIQIGVRCFNRDVRNHLSKRIPEIIEHTVKMWRGRYNLINFSTPSTYNDEKLTDTIVRYAAEVAGDDNMIFKNMPMSGTEDFSYISDKVPSVFMKLGAGKPGNYPMHNPNVILDEDAMPIGAAVLANCAIEWLKSH